MSQQVKPHQALWNRPSATWSWMQVCSSLWWFWWRRMTVNFPRLLLWSQLLRSSFCWQNWLAPVISATRKVGLSGDWFRNSRSSPIDLYHPRTGLGSAVSIWWFPHGFLMVHFKFYPIYDGVLMVLFNTSLLYKPPGIHSDPLVSSTIVLWRTMSSVTWWSAWGSTRTLRLVGRGPHLYNYTIYIHAMAP